MRYLKRAERSPDRGNAETEEVVKGIIADVRDNGDEAVLRYERRFSASTRDETRVSDAEIEQVLAAVDSQARELIDRVVERVEAFARAQLACLSPLESAFGDGILLGHRLVPVSSVGAYIPGGRFPLLSAAPMVIVPARVAGAQRIVACTPASYRGGIHPAVMYGLVRSGATEIYAIGGAQAIAAMAYGTESLEPVDMVAGPGNRFVAEAKRQVYGQVGIDLLAGPSEVLVLADDTANPPVVAADLIAQAEHDPFARAILVTTSPSLGASVLREVEALLASLPEGSPARESWPNMGEVVLAESLAEALEICNRYAPEHLHVQIREPRSVMPGLHNYGSLFLGADSSVVFSDKVSGTNHTLPTLGGARYTGGLWVGSYVKVLTHQEILPEGVSVLAAHAARQAEIEGLEGHRRSAAARLGAEIR
jgi:histidinol dehydrogenase/sulfopropanediol 3-dehydrogenase